MRGEQVKPRTWHWRTNAPFDALPSDRDFLIEALDPFVLHLGFDGWHDVVDKSSSPLPFGGHGVRLSQPDLQGRGVLDFTRYFLDEARWEGTDYHVTLAVTPQQNMSKGLRDVAAHPCMR